MEIPKRIREIKRDRIYSYLKAVRLGTGILTYCLLQHRLQSLFDSIPNLNRTCQYQRIFQAQNISRVLFKSTTAMAIRLSRLPSNCLPPSSTSKSLRQFSKLRTMELLFKVRVISIQYTPVHILTISGQVLCRLPDETAEVCEIGKLLRESSEHCQLVFQEEDGLVQRFQITTEAVQRMVNSLHFRLDGIQLRVVKNLPFRAVLRWRGEEFSISGFPRILLLDPSKTMSKIALKRLKVASTLANTCYKGRRQASQWTDQEKHHQKYHRKQWTVPVSDEPAIGSFGPNTATSIYELPTTVISGSSRSEQNRQKAAQVEVLLPRGLATDGTNSFNTASLTNHLAENFSENDLSGAAGPSSSRKMPTLSSVVAPSATFNETTRTNNSLRSSRYLTIKFSTDEGMLRDIDRMNDLKSIADLAYTFLELNLLNNFVQSMTQSNGADHTTPLLISSTNLGRGDSTRIGLLSSEILATSDHEDPVLDRDVLSRDSISSSIPPRLPEFSWQNEPTVMFELVDT